MLYAQSASDDFYLYMAIPHAMAILNPNVQMGFHKFIEFMDLPNMLL